MERETDEALKRAVGEVPPESARSDVHDDRREDESSSHQDADRASTKAQDESDG